MDAFGHGGEGGGGVLGKLALKYHERRMKVSNNEIIYCSNNFDIKTVY